MTQLRRPEAAAARAGLIGGLVLLLAAIMTLSACGRTPRPTNPSDASVSAAPEFGVATGLTVIPPDEREQAPDLAGPTLTGGTLDVASLRGKAVLINSWASWCEPCREETPVLVDLAEAHPELAVVGINVNDRPEAAREFADQMSVPYPSIVDPRTELLPRIPGVPPKALPSTVVLDRGGRIAARVIGPVTEAMVPELLAAAGARTSAIGQNGTTTGDN